MTLIKTLKPIIDFLMRLPKDTKEAIRRYKNQLSTAKESKVVINMAKNDLMYFFVVNWLIKVLAPLTVLTLIIILIVKYFIPILGAVFIGHIIQSHLAERKKSKITQQKQKNEFVYRDVTKFIYSPLGELTTWLNVRKPQLMDDITIMPYCDTQNGIDRLYFQLFKKNPESIEEDKLAFSRQMLQSLITTRLKKKEASESLRLFYNDEPCLFVESVTDLGESVYIQLVHVINEESYNYVKKKMMGKSPNEIKNLLSDEDEDF